MSRAIKPMGYWTKENLQKEALKYGYKKEFQIKAGGAYTRAHKLGLLNDICGHMSRPKNYKYKWSFEKVAVEALRFKSRMEFKHGESGAYYAGVDNGWLDEVCSHMEQKINPRNYWSVIRLKHEALKYTTRTQFREGSPSAYTMAHRLNLMFKICGHMVRPETTSGFDPNKPAILYYLSINNGDAYKIGITNKTVDQRYTTKDMSKITIMDTRLYQIGHDARKEEKRILREFDYAKYKGISLLKDGNTELFDRDVLGLDNVK